MHRVVSSCVVVLLVGVFVGYTAGGAERNQKTGEAIAKRLLEDPVYPAFDIPAAWGELVAMTSTGGGLAHGADETHLAFRANDGTLRIVYMRGGLPSLSHEIGRSDTSAVSSSSR